MTDSRKPLLLCSLLALLTLLPVSQARQPAAAEKLRIKLYPAVELTIPQTQEADRVYLQTKFRHDVVKAQAVADRKTLIKALGTSQTTSMPPELVQNYGKRFTEVIAFPIAPLKEAKERIEFEFHLDNGKTKHVLLKGEKLARFQQNLP